MTYHWSYCHWGLSVSDHCIWNMDDLFWRSQLFPMLTLVCTSKKLFFWPGRANAHYLIYLLPKGDYAFLDSCSNSWSLRYPKNWSKCTRRLLLHNFNFSFSARCRTSSNSTDTELFPAKLHQSSNKEKVNDPPFSVGRLLSG